jgi:hypothetical protein
MRLLRWLFVLALCVPAMGFTPLSWEDHFLARIELLAVIETLNADLLSHPSATLTLERWWRITILPPPRRLLPV